MQLPVSDTEVEPDVTITTDGDTIKPFVNAVSHVVDECKMHFTEDGIRVTAVDPSNVIMIDQTVFASAFDSYEMEYDELVVGVNITALQRAIRRARVNHDDTLSISVSTEHIKTEVTRGYDDADVVSFDSFRTIDPDSIRQEPSLPVLELEHSAELNAGTFADAFGHVHEAYEYFEIVDSDGIEILGESDTEESKTVIDDKGNSSGATSMFSAGMFGRLQSAIMAAKSDTVTLNYDDEMPTIIDYERKSDGETVINGEVMQAPRIRS